MPSSSSDRSLTGGDEHYTGGEGWVTLKKMAILIEKDYRTTRKLIVDGKIRAIRVGGTFRIYESEVRRFLQQGNHPDPQPNRK
jgi:excisionase family DNA binding protein